jgi:hypothetical protein
MLLVGAAQVGCVEGEILPKYRIIAVPHQLAQVFHIDSVAQAPSGESASKRMCAQVLGQPRAFADAGDCAP